MIPGKKPLNLSHLLASISILFIVLFFNTPIIAAELKNNTYEDNDLYLRFVFRTAEQTAAFYEGREFPKTAIQHITKSCYITTIMKNRSDQVIWIDLNNWEFESNGKNIKRITMSDWMNQWQTMKLEQAYRSTFSWTLMPEVKDLLPEENVGGNVTIPMQASKFTLSLRLVAGDKNNGKVKNLVFKDLACKDVEKP